MAKKNTITLPDGTVVSHKKPLKEQMYKYRWFYFDVPSCIYLCSSILLSANVRYCLFIHRVQAD